jgi:hypothetical protein
MAKGKGGSYSAAYRHPDDPERAPLGVDCRGVPLGDDAIGLRHLSDDAVAVLLLAASLASGYRLPLELPVRLVSHGALPRRRGHRRCAAENPSGAYSGAVPAA